MKDSLEKETGEYRRECEYFSYSRLEDETGGSGGWEEAFDSPPDPSTSGVNGDPGQSPPDQGIDAAAAAASSEVNSSLSSNDSDQQKEQKANNQKPMDVLEMQVFKLIKQVSDHTT